MNDVKTAGKEKRLSGKMDSHLDQFSWPFVTIYDSDSTEAGEYGMVKMLRSRLVFLIPAQLPGGKELMKRRANTM